MPDLGDRYAAICGDAANELLRLPEQSVDLIFTSPPYYNARAYASFPDYAAYLAFLAGFAAQAQRILKPARLLVVNLSCVIEPRTSRATESTRYPIPFDFVPIASAAGFKFLDDIVWQKPDGASSRAIKFSHHRRPVAYKPFTVTEYLLVFRRSDGGLLDTAIRSHDAATIRASLIGDGYERTNVWQIAPTSDPRHPATFPQALAQRVITYYSYRGDTVLDPYMGSGTTGTACARLGRNFIGIERDPAYFATAEQRIAATHAQLPIPEAT